MTKSSLNPEDIAVIIEFFDFLKIPKSLELAEVINAYTANPNEFTHEATQILRVALCRDIINANHPFINQKCFSDFKNTLLKVLEKDNGKT